MAEELITGENPRIQNMLTILDRLETVLEEMAKNYSPLLMGERYMTDTEVSKALKVSRRTLQDYRNNRIIPYCTLGGKLLYKVSDIEKRIL